MIRELEDKFDRPIGILADVQGPKLRVGTFGGGRVLPADRPAVPARPERDAGRRQRVNLPHPEIIEAAVDRLHAAAGRRQAAAARRAQAGRRAGDRGRGRRPAVRPQGRQRARRGAADPGADRRRTATTWNSPLQHGANYIGLSFVQRPEDVAEAKELIGGRAWVMVKLEKPQALDNLDGILELTDAVMVARGDLGVELPPEEVPLAQKRIVRLSRQLGKPVVVATQMLESMITAPAPTRAEASDVATAVFDGADAVMLSGGDRGRAVPVRGGEHDGPHRRAGGAG